MGLTMKSNALDKTKVLQTSCKNCLFAKYDKKTQVGCSVGRIDKFKKQNKVTEAMDDEKEFYVIDRLCNLYRDWKWPHYGDSGKQTEIALNEVSPKFGIVVYGSDEDTTKVLDAIESIKALDYNKGRLAVIISMIWTKGDHHHRIFEEINNLRDSGIKKTFFISNFYNDQKIIDTEAFKNCVGCNYLVKMSHDSIIDKDLLNNINKSINQDLEQIVLFEDGNISVIPLNVASSQYLKYDDYQVMIQAIKVEAIKNNMYKNMGQ